ncbi:MAG: metalloregulator ArsR/SmtB family transcription factor [Verrucomicrobia bacterium]|nr:metalloregulator ArsR/SmtB family transcription factor [Verrucomicrobiota bacterium]
MKTKRQEIPVELLAHMADALKVLAHPHRLKIIEILEQEGEAPVGDIVDYIALPQAATSQHLNKMKRVGLISSSRYGKNVCYRILDDRCITILNCIRTNACKR